MSEPRITDHGTTITIEQRHGDQVIVLHAPDAPEDMRETEAGRIVTMWGKPGFQPAMFFPALFSPSALRIIADLIEENHNA